MAQFPCPHCGGVRNGVTHTVYREKRKDVWRRRKCVACGTTFRTKETFDAASTPNVKIGSAR